MLGAPLAGFVIFRMAFMLLIVRLRRTSGWGTAPDPVRNLLRSMVPGEFEAAAQAIGVEPGELRRDVDCGRSIAELTTAAAVAVDDVVAAIVRSASARIDLLVGEGIVSAETATQARERLPLWAARLVERRKSGLRRARGLT